MLAGDGVEKTEIAERLGSSRPTVLKWLGRYSESGIEALGNLRVKLHVIADNYGTHKHANVTAWLAKNPRTTMHFTPTSCSWLNMVEIFFGIITRQAIRRGTFESVTDFKDAIRTCVNGYNTRCEPFT
ncbi:hypothetical protein GCM10009612_40160 [Streptomyces beijiangensis]